MPHVPKSPTAAMTWSCKSLVHAFKELGVVLDKSPINDKAVSQILFTLKIDTWKDSYKGLTLTHLVQNQEWANTPEKCQAITKVLTVCSYFIDKPLDQDPAEADLQSLITSYAKFTGKQSAKTTSPTGQKTTSLQKFDGDESKWFLWKERTIARFKIDGLYGVVSDTAVAALNPIKNLIVHGLLVEALLTEDNSVVFPCLLKEARENGCLAWKKLNELFEHKELIKTTCKQNHHHFMRLTCSSLSEWDTFTPKFLNLMNQMIILQDKATELKTNIDSYRVNEWKTHFLEKITIPTLNGLIENLKADDNVCVWEAFLTLKGSILAKRNLESNRSSVLPNQKDKSKGKRKRTDKEEEDKQPEAAPKGNNDKGPKQDPAMQRALANVDKLDETEEFKSKMKKLLLDAKQGSKKPGFADRKKRRRNKANRRTPSGGPKVNFEAVEILGGDEGHSSGSDN